MRVVFVDDEQNVLDGMRRNLHGMRAEWAMEFIPSAELALTALARVPADVVVADMRMPGMDGAQLLSEVKRLYPQTIRLILSGHADPDSIMRVVGTAHQFLAKPCDSAVLKVVISRAQVLRRLLRDERAAVWAGRIDTLPTLPGAYQELVMQLQKSDTSLADIGRLIGRDVAMTAAVLKVVNSAFFGAPQTIHSIDRAVAFLGIDMIKSLVLANGVFKECGAVVPPTFNLARLWQHSLQTAIGARALAVHERWDAARVEGAFLAAFLHDVGGIVLATRPARTALRDRVPEDADSDTNLAVDHAEVGAYILGTWGFQDVIVEAIAFHHTPSKAADGALGLAGMVHVADYLAHLHDTTDSPKRPVLDSAFLESPEASARLRAWQAAWPDAVVGATRK
jgi:HD-like signal output (HDOD) protein